MRGRDTNLRRQWRGRGKDDTVGNKKISFLHLKWKIGNLRPPFSFIRLSACLSLYQFLNRISDISQPLYCYQRYGINVHNLAGQ